MCVLTTCPKLHTTVQQLGFEPATFQSQVQRPTQSTTNTGPSVCQHVITYWPIAGCPHWASKKSANGTHDGPTWRARIGPQKNDSERPLLNYNAMPVLGPHFAGICKRLIKKTLPQFEINPTHCHWVMQLVKSYTYIYYGISKVTPVCTLQVRG